MFAFQPLSTAQPDAKELKSTDLLRETLKSFNVTEPIAETMKRVEVLRKLNSHVKEWIKRITAEKMPSESGFNAGGMIVSFGSYRLGVHTSGSDIDTLCLAPRHVTRQDFFTSFKAMLLKDSNVKELNAVETAFVPIMTMQYNGIEVDVLFARLDVKTVPDNLDVLDDSLLKNMDPESVRSINGCRVAEQLLKMVPRTKEFCETLRVIKLWAKNHGLSSNAMGFFGGVTWAILVARTCQLYPNATASKLVEKFFFLWSTWRWPTPVALTNPNLLRNDLPTLANMVWNPRGPNTADRYHLMPILTPAFPEQNSTHNTSTSTASVIKSAMEDALQICSKINNGTAAWKDLFEGVNFFSRYKTFLALVTAAPNKTDELSFTGFFESRLRFLVRNLESNRSIQLAHINPKMFKPTASAEFDVNKENKHQNVWFIGLEFADHAKNLDLTSEIERFKKTIREQAPNSTVQLDMFPVKRSNLIKVIPAADLKTGRFWKKPTGEDVTVTDSNNRKRPIADGSGSGSAKKPRGI